MKKNGKAHRDARCDFSRYRFEKIDIPDLARLADRHRASPAEFLPLIELLNARPLGTFENIGSLHANCHGGNSEPSPACIKLMRDLLLGSVDRRLQNIYREHFRSDPSTVGGTHEERIASLDTARDEILSVLERYDWHWLAGWLDLSRIGETAASCLRRLANFAFPIKQVNFRFTYHCNIACRHCYNHSGPHRKTERLSLDAMLGIVAEMPEAGINHLNLSGGEPFLYQNELLALISAGRAAGLKGISIYTNGFWASTDERAARILERLAQCGFMQGSADHIRVSGGVYHQEFITFDRILILARNYYTRFGQRLRVDFELPPQAGDLANEVRNRITAAQLGDQVKLQFRIVGSLGRGKDIGEIRTDVTDPPPCDKIYEIAFDPDGSVRPCCGGNGDHHGILIGAAGQQHRLKHLAKRMQNDSILQFIATHPMSEIFAYVPTTMRKAGYSGRCDLCMDALGGLTDKEPLQASLFGQQKFYPFWFSLGAE